MANIRCWPIKKKNCQHQHHVFDKGKRRATIIRKCDFSFLTFECMQLAHAKFRHTVKNDKELSRDYNLKAIR